MNNQIARQFANAKKKASELLKNNQVDRDAIIEDIRNRRIALIKKKPGLRLKPIDSISDKDIIVSVANKIMNQSINIKTAS